MFNEKIYIIGSDYKRKLFGIKSSNIYGEQPNWYLENNNNESLFINKDKLTRYSHNIYINSEYVIGEKTIKWFPYITDYSHSGELKPKLYILDDILLPYTFEVKLEYWNNETSKTEYKELEVVKKYSLEKITWNSNNSQILIPYFEIRMPNYFINNEYNDKQKLLINYDLLNDVMLGNSFLIYNNGNYNPFIKYINY